MDRLAELLRQGADRLVNLPSEAQRFITNPQAFTQLLTGKNPLPRETGFAAGATGLPAQEMSVLDPNQAPYMQGYTQGEPIGYAGMAAPFAAPATVATAKALAPKAGMMAENYMVKQGMMPTVVPSNQMSWEKPKKPKNSVLVDIPLNVIEHGESAMAGGKLTWPTAKQTIKEYAERKTDFPPIEVMGNDPSYQFYDKPFMIYDGSHRYEAAKLRGDKTIKAYVSKSDADAINALDQLKNSRKELIKEQINKIE